MKVISCEKGHFYDADKYDECPICKRIGIETPDESERSPTKIYDEHGGILLTVIEQSVPLSRFEKVFTHKHQYNMSLKVEKKYVLERYKLSICLHYISKTGCVIEINDENQTEELFVRWDEETTRIPIKSFIATEHIYYLTIKVKRHR